MLVANDAETLDPRHATDPVGLRTTRLLHAGLSGLDPDTMAPRPLLARSWAWIDSRTLRVELRQDVRFHSGAPLRPLDVIATIKAFASKEVGSRHARVVEPIERIDADGEHAVIIHLRHAHATLLTDLEIPILRADEAAAPPRPDGSLDGLGPFVVAAREPGAIRLTPAAGGALPTPARSVILRTVHDENARALRLHAGRADLVVNGFSPTLLPAFDGKPALRVASREGANLTYMVMRLDRGPLADVRVRRAISAAIDRERIAKTLLAGRAQAASTLLPPANWAHTDAPSMPFDPSLARELPPLKLTLITSTDRLRGTIARLVAQELAEVGVEIEVVPLELGTMIARLGAGDFELAILQMPELTEPNVLRVFMHSTSIPPAGANRGRIRDALLDHLLDEGAESPDPLERRAIYAQLEAHVREEAFILPLWHEDQVWVTTDRARAFTASADGRWLSLATLP